MYPTLTYALYAFGLNVKYCSADGAPRLGFTETQNVIWVPGTVCEAEEWNKEENLESGKIKECLKGCMKQTRKGRNRGRRQSKRR
jgi:hypothetical protein